MTTAALLRLADGAVAGVDFGNGRPIPTGVYRRGEWIDFAATPDIGEGIDPWGLLQLNDHLREPVRVTLDRDRCRLRAEVRSPSVAAIQQVRRSFREANHLLCGGGRRPTATPAAGAAAWDHWTAVVRAAGWPTTARADGRLVVDLDLREERRQATAEPWGDRLRVSVKLGDVAPAAECRLAVSRYLLLATNDLRLVRATYAPDRGLALSVVVSRGSPAAGVDDALSALALGCRLAGREAEALGERAFARRYLDITHTKEQ